MPIGEALRWLANQDPHAPAVRDRQMSLTRAEFVEAMERYAEVLLAEGVRVDDLVTIRLPNTVEFVIVCAAIWLVGATPQPLNSRLPLTEQRDVVERADARVVIGATQDEFPGHLE